MPSKEIQCNFLIVLELIKLWGLLKNPGNIRYVLYINFYVLLSLLFIFQKNFTTFMTIRTFFFFFRKILISFTSIFLLFIFFFFRKILIPCTTLFSKSLFVFMIGFCWHFYICEKIFHWIFIHSKTFKIAWKHFNHLNQQLC